MTKLASLTDSNLLGKDQLIQNENAEGVGDACEAPASRQALCQTLTHETKSGYTCSLVSFLKLLKYLTKNLFSNIKLLVEHQEESINK